jgi:hypothetical protein
MKVFISHSTRDKWIARKISKELEALGAATFLDEKDIETGESIDEAIGDHLKESDELLMLVSPAALTSHWVLIEVGGAKALGKRLVPILLHVSPNDLPAPLTMYLARDLNDIDRYYDEVRARLKGAAPRAAPPERKVRPRVVKRSFKMGDRVLIARRGTKDVLPGWNDDMDHFVGKEATVTGESERDTVRLDVDDGQWYWDLDWLEPAG